MKTCIWPDCDKKSIARSLCDRDYKRSQSLGHPGNPWDVWVGREYVKNPVERCVWPDCTLDGATGRGLCSMHWQRAYKLGFPDEPWVSWEEWEKSKAEPKICQWPGCYDKVVGRSLCSSHWQKSKRLGFPEDPWIVWDALNPIAAPGMKICTKCNQELPWDKFAPAKLGRFGVRSDCKRCSRGRDRKRRELEKRLHWHKVSESFLIDRDGSGCGYCHTPLDIETFVDVHMDHIFPLSKEGPGTYTNYVLACADCNLSKSDRDPADWIALKGFTPVPAVTEIIEWVKMFDY